MRRLSVIALAAVLLVAAASAHVAAAEPSENVYVSLGDSVAAGTQQPHPFTDNGYTNSLFNLVQAQMRLTEHVNLACPADDTYEMIDGADGPGSGSLCYGSEAPLAPFMPANGDSQLDVALDYFAQVHADGGEVGLITLTIGANDLFRCEDFSDECVAEALLGVATNLQGTILPSLREGAPEAAIVAMDYYNPNLAYWLVPGGEAFAEATNVLTAVSNEVLNDSYAVWDVPVANVAHAFGTFDTGGREIPNNVNSACDFTLMCDSVDGEWQLGVEPDIHPSDAGYLQIARTFDKTIRDEGIR